MVRIWLRLFMGATYAVLAGLLLLALAVLQGDDRWYVLVFFGPSWRPPPGRTGIARCSGRRINRRAKKKLDFRIGSGRRTAQPSAEQR